MGFGGVEWGEGVLLVVMSHWVMRPDLDEGVRRCSGVRGG